MATYSWTRYLCPADSPPVKTRDGFFTGPGSKLPGFHSVRNNFSTLSSLYAEPCIVLLGEPGIGKTTALKEERDRLRTEGANVYYQELGGLGPGLEEIIADQPWRTWVEGREDFHCMLDGLDEGGENANRLVSAIIRQMKRAPEAVKRFMLRVTCRTWHWPPSLQGLLMGTYGDSLQVYRMVPLQQKDAEAAAAEEGIDAELFMGRVLAMRAGALAARPVTLKMLLNTFEQKGQLPATQAELYEKGCELLCTEPVVGRQRNELIQGERPWNDSRQLLAVAGRLGVATLCANRPVITSDDGNSANGDVPLAALTGGREPFLGVSEIEVDATLIHQVLRTGLFASQGQGRFGWAHQSYAEYLTARRLKTVPLEQIEQLLCLPQSPGTCLVPKLRETGGWPLCGRMSICG